MSDGPTLHEGFALHEGLVSHEGIDLDKTTRRRIGMVRGKREVEDKTFREPRAGRRPKRKKEAYIRLPKVNDRSRWVTQIILPTDWGMGGGGGRSSGGGGNEGVSGPSGPKVKSAYAKRMAVLSSAGYSRRCTVRFKYTKPNSSVSGSRKIASYAGVKGSMDTGQYNAGMVGYISRAEAAVENNPEWEDANRETPLFTVEGGKKRMLNASEAIGIIGDSSVFTVIISPEDKGADPADLADRFMMKLANKLKQKSIPWVAATHHNTEHDHVHIIVKREIDGQVLQIPPNYIKKGARKDCEDILTDMLGERNWQDELEKTKNIAKEHRFTQTDKMLLAISRYDKENPGDIPTYRIRNRSPHESTLLLERLKALRKLRLVSCTKDGIWHLKPGFEENIRKQEYVEALDLNDVSDCILDKDKTPYIGTVMKFARPNEEDRKVFMLIVGEDGLKHLRTDYIDTEVGNDAPEGPCDISRIEALMRSSIGGKTR